MAGTDDKQEAAALDALLDGGPTLNRAAARSRSLCPAPSP